MLEIVEGGDVEERAETALRGIGATSDEPFDVVRVHARPARQDEQPLHRVAQFANVAGPVALLESRHGIVANCFRCETAGTGELRDEVSNERRNVLAPLAERWHVNRHHVEPVVEIFAEPPRRDLLLHHLVRGREHTHVHLHRLRAANSCHHPVLQDAQHLRLRGETHVANLVEKQRPAVGLLELARAVGDRSGKRALDVTEQLTLDQLARDRRTVHLHKRPLRARRLRVHRARDELLTGPVFSGNQHARRRFSHERNFFRHRPDRVGIPDNLEARMHRIAQPLVLLLEIQVRQRIPQGDENAVRIERLLENVVRAMLRRFDRGLDGGVPADHDDHGVRILLPQLAQRLQPVDSGHLHIHEDEMRMEARILR